VVVEFAQAGESLGGRCAIYSHGTEAAFVAQTSALHLTKPWLLLDRRLVGLVGDDLRVE
jgi:hypothetical protein